MKIDAAALSALSKEDLIALLTQALVQNPTEAPEATEEKVTCAFPTAAGHGCTRNATQEDARCKTHTGKDEPTSAPTSTDKGKKFYEEVIVGKAEQRKSRKERNRALAAALRKEGKTPNGDVWAAALHLVTEDDLSIEDAAVLA